MKEAKLYCWETSPFPQRVLCSWFVLYAYLHQIVFPDLNVFVCQRPSCELPSDGLQSFDDAAVQHCKHFKATTSYCSSTISEITC